MKVCTSLPFDGHAGLGLINEPITPEGSQLSSIKRPSVLLDRWHELKKQRNIAINVTSKGDHGATIREACLALVVQGAGTVGGNCSLGIPFSGLIGKPGLMAFSYCCAPELHYAPQGSIHYPKTSKSLLQFNKAAARTRSWAMLSCTSCFLPLCPHLGRNKVQRASLFGFYGWTINASWKPSSRPNKVQEKVGLRQHHRWFLPILNHNTFN